MTLFKKAHFLLPFSATEARGDATSLSFAATISHFPMETKVPLHQYFLSQDFVKLEKDWASHYLVRIQQGLCSSEKEKESKFPTWKTSEPIFVNKV